MSLNLDEELLFFQVYTKSHMNSDIELIKEEVAVEESTLKLQFKINEISISFQQDDSIFFRIQLRNIEFSSHASLSQAFVH